MQELQTVLVASLLARIRTQLTYDRRLEAMRPIFRMKEHLKKNQLN